VKILFLSSLYSSPRFPDRSPPNARILHAMRRHAEIRVIAPVPFYPRVLVRNRPALRQLAEAPASEVDDDGSTILHPRWLHIPLTGRSLYGAMFALSVATTLRREVRRFRPDVLLSAWAYPDSTAAVLLSRLFGLPCVVRTMGSDINDFAQRPGRRGQIVWALSRAERVIAVSRSLTRALEGIGVPGDRIVTIPTGVDRARFSPRDRDRARNELGLSGVCVLAPGRLAPEKGFGDLIQALGKMDRRDVTLVLVGEGGERTRLAARAGALGLGDRVRFEGFQPEAKMPLYYAAADLVCLPSHQEGWPNVLMESAACGCPFVASDVGGVSEIQALTGGGLIVAPGQPEALAAALSAALQRPWNRTAIAAAVAPYSLDATAQRYVEVCAAAALS
jgi:glycosyltransferase involved in cell wall biosynthesis